MAAPAYVSSSEAAKTITISWTKPQDNGGCAVTGYELYRNAGSDDLFDQSPLSTRITSMSSTDPSLIQHTIDLSSSGTVGHYYKFKVVV
jgi:hypothetical protein